MGTKNAPGKFDCYANAEPDEPMFVLLARDRHAPQLIRLWADLREASGERPEKVQEARDCAEACEAWRGAHRPPANVDWQRAVAHVQTCKQQYADLLGTPGVNVGYALNFVIEPLLRRYNEGERTCALHAAMLDVQ